MSEDGFLLDQSTVNTLGTVFTRVLGPTGSPVGGRVPNGAPTQIKHVRLTAVQSPAPSAEAEMMGYTAEIMKIDYATKTLVGTGVTFDPNGDTEDQNIIKNYVYEVNKNGDLAGKVVSISYKYVSSEEANGAWVFTGVGGSRPIVMLTGNSVSLNAGEFLGDVIDDRVSQNVLTANVTVVAHQMSSGELPIAGSSGTRFWRADVAANDENIVDASGVGAPPDSVYEIQPPVWF